MALKLVLGGILDEQGAGGRGPRLMNRGLVDVELAMKERAVRKMRQTKKKKTMKTIRTLFGSVGPIPRVR